MGKNKHTLKNTADVIRIVHSLDRFKIPLLLLRSFLKAAVPFVVALLSAEVVNRLVLGENADGIIRFALYAVLVIFALNLLTGWVKRVDEVKNEQCVRLYNLRKNKKLMEMDYPELENPALSEMLTKIRMNEMMGLSLPQAFTCLDSMCKGLFVVLLTVIWLAPVLAGLPGKSAVFIGLFALGSFLFSGIAALLFKRSNDKVFKIIQTKPAAELALVEHLAYMGGLDYKDGKDVRIYGFSEKIRHYFQRAFDHITSVASSCAVKPALAFGISGAVRAVSMGGCYLLGALLVLAGNMELGTVVLFSALLYQCSDAFTDILIPAGLFFVTAESMQKVVQFTATPDTQYKGTIPIEKRSDNEYDIEFRSVSFQYPGSKDYALRDFSIRFKIGERLAIVGMNGSGKTTMIKLLCRLYDPTEGEILLNGVDIQKYDRKEYMSVFSVVFQDYKLFSLELGQVLAASASYDESRAQNCLARAGFEERLRTLPNGVKTVLYKDFEDGVELSGGEAQKTALARALYKDAPFIILDEPTAALDPAAEYEIYTRINEIVGGKTAVFISHRLSSCRFCDDIAVFHEGRMIQRGSHDVLVADQKGKYYELWSAQAQHYNKSAG